MEFLKKKNSVIPSELLYVMCSFGLVLINFFNIFESFNIPFLSGLASFKLYIMVLFGIIFLICVFYSFFKCKVAPFYSIIFGYVSLFFLVSSFLNERYSPFSIKEFLSTVIWWLLLFGFLLDFCKPCYSVFINIVISIFVVVLGFMYVFLAYRIRTPASVNSIYYLLFLLPFILNFFKQSYLKISLSVFISVVSFFSMKTTVYIELFLFWYVYLLFFLKKKDIKKYTTFKVLLFIVLSFGLIGVLVYSFCFPDPVEKLNEITSYRIDLYSQSLNGFVGSDFSVWHLFFGYGYNSVLIKNGMSAHSDLIEVLCDYGLIGFLLLISAIAFLYIHLFRQDSERPANRAFFVLLLITLLTSHLLFISRYFYFVILFIFCTVKYEKILPNEFNQENLAVIGI